MKNRYSPGRIILRTLATTSLAFGVLSPSFGNTRIGTNLDSVKDFNTQPFFYNLMNHCRGWVAKDNTTGSGKNWDYLSDDRSGLIPQRSFDGYPTQVPFTAWGNQAWVFTFVPLYETGTHKFQVSGRGEIRYKIPGAGWTTKTLNGGTTSFNVNVSTVADLSQFKSGKESRVGVDTLTLEITDSKSWDPVRDIRIMRPGHHGAGKHAFDAGFKNYLSFYDTLRFMDWGRTNDNPQVNWSDRTTEHWYSQGTDHGIAYEHMIRLANELNKDLWVCVPHQASNSFVDNMASLFNSQTEGARDIFLEYSNEVWNGIFDQASWMDNSGFSGANRMEKYGTRAAQIFDRWYNQFNNPESRIIRVIGGQAKNDWQALQALEKAGSKTDALAIAPYFGGTIEAGEISNGIPSNNQLAQEPWLEMDEVQTALDEHKALADTYGVQLIAYEGGQHYVGLFAAVNDQNLTDRLLEFNRSWQMRNLYRWDYLDRLSDSGMLLFCNFAAVGAAWSKSGSWPTMEYMGQPINNSEGNAVKEWALRDWKADNPNGADVQPGIGGSGGGGGGGGSGGTVTFNDKSHGNAANSYTAEGLTVSALKFNGSASSLDFLANNYNSTVVRTDNWGESIKIVSSTGGSFDLTGFDHAGVWGNSYDANITGTKSGGATVNASISGSGNNLTTKSLNWTNLVEVVIDYDGGSSDRFGVIDNLDQGN